MSSNVQIDVWFYGLMALHESLQSDSLMSFQQIDDGVTDLQDELTEFSKENEINDEFFM